MIADDVAFLQQRLDHLLGRERAPLRAAARACRSLRPRHGPIDQLLRLKLGELLLTPPGRAGFRGLLGQPLFRAFVGRRCPAQRDAEAVYDELERVFAADGPQILLGAVAADKYLRFGLRQLAASVVPGFPSEARLDASVAQGRQLAERQGSRPSAPRRLLRAACRIALLLAAVVAGFLAWVYQALPSSQQVALIVDRPSYEVELAADGAIAFHAPVFPVPVDIDSLPQHLLDAVVANEDRWFWRHPGIDPVGIVRGLLRRGGTSTLTQQLAKLVFLESDQSIIRKIRDVLLAFKLELAFDKRQLLALYLNRAPFGNGMYGVEQAARFYFGVRARQLNLYQSAMLAKMLPAPEARNPVDDLQAARRFAALALDGMVAAGVLDAGLRQRTIAEWGQRTRAQLRTGDRDVPRLEHGWFRDWIAGEIAGLGIEPGQRLRVIVTLEPLAQLYAQVSVRGVLGDLAKLGDKAALGGALAMRPDGAVTAMVGGGSYARSQWNNTTQALVTPSSTFKLFLYLAALETGYTPADTVDDTPLQVEGRPWPANFDGRYRGRIPLRTAVEQSSNAAAVRLARALGLERVAAMATRLGIATPLRLDLSLPLGTSEVKLVELTAAYATLANGGRTPRPYGVMAVQSRSGALRYWHAPAATETLTPPRVATMRSLLRSVVAAGTGRRANVAPDIMGKTGTAQDGRSALFVGLTDTQLATFWFARGPASAVTVESPLATGAYARFYKNLNER
ncbi:MAG: transglycosylase domain-containing protein [Geminicoccaceae bacterium]